MATIEERVAKAAETLDRYPDQFPHWWEKIDAERFNFNPGHSEYCPLGLNGGWEKGKSFLRQRGEWSTIVSIAFNSAAEDGRLAWLSEVDKRLKSTQRLYKVGDRVRVIIPWYSDVKAGDVLTIRAVGYSTDDELSEGHGPQYIYPQIGGYTMSENVPAGPSAWSECFELVTDEPTIRKWWAVVRINAGSSRREFTVYHVTREAAEGEAKRLAKENRGSSFAVLELLSTFAAQEPPVEKREAV